MLLQIALFCSFLWPAVFHCVYVPHLLYPSVSGHLRCFCVLVIVSRAAMNVVVHCQEAFNRRLPVDLSGILCSLLIPEYSGIRRRGKPLPGLRIQAFPSLVFQYGVSTLFLLVNHKVKVIVYNSLSL